MYAASPNRESTPGLRTRILRYGDWTLRGLMVTLFTIAGAMKLTSHPFELNAFAHFGYDTWFMYAIGLIEFVAAFAILHARLMLPAIALLAAVLIGAVASHVQAGDPPEATIPAVIALAILASLALIYRSGRSSAPYARA